jgi:hypothetical protein
MEALISRAYEWKHIWRGDHCRDNQIKRSIIDYILIREEMEIWDTCTQKIKDMWW